MRAYVLQVHPVCTDCQRSPATVADHIDGDAMNNEMANLTGLCASCHSRKTVERDGGFGRAPSKRLGCDVDGWPRDRDG
jgi:5-methylcytosine-specific restriction protein A